MRWRLLDRTSKSGTAKLRLSSVLVGGAINSAGDVSSEVNRRTGRGKCVEALRQIQQGDFKTAFTSPSMVRFWRGALFGVRGVLDQPLELDRGGHTWYDFLSRHTASSYVLRLCGYLARWCHICMIPYIRCYSSIAPRLSPDALSLSPYSRDSCQRALFLPSQRWPTVPRSHTGQQVSEVHVDRCGCPYLTNSSNIYCCTRCNMLPCSFISIQGVLVYPARFTGRFRWTAAVCSPAHPGTP